MPENEEPERKIPVFTVVKNGAILKNIFIVNKPPPLLPPPSDFGNEDDPGHCREGDGEEILVVGRHPDCHIMLTHPSVSRFHFQIHSKPSSQSLTVIDLSSVHGTWVSEKKIQPCVPVEMKEGDTLRVGGSTRVYRLHWIPMSQAYDLDTPFVSPFDVPMEDVQPEESELFVNENKMQTLGGEKSESIEIGKSEVRDSLVAEPKEEETFQGLNSLLIEEFKHDQVEDSLLVEGKEGICQDEILVPAQNEAIQFLDWTLEGIVLLFSEEKSELSLKTENPPLTEAMDLFCPVGSDTSVLEEKQFDKNDQILSHDSMTEISPERENLVSSLRSEKKSEVLVNLVASPSNEKQWEMPDETENQRPLQEEDEIVNNLEVCSHSLIKESENSSLISAGVLSEMKTEQVNKEKQTLQSLVVLQQLEEEMKENFLLDQNLNMPMTLNTAFSDEECYLAAELFEAENNSTAREGHEQKETPGSFSALLEAESVNSSFPIGEVLSEITENKNSQTPQSMFAPARCEEQENSEVCPLQSDKRPSSNSIWSRRGKPASVLQIQTGRSRGKTCGQNNVDIQLQKQENIENKSFSKMLFLDSAEREEEIFTPDKENFSPDTLLLKSFKRKCKLEEKKHSRSCRKSCSKVSVSPNMQLEESGFSSDKENQTPKVLQEQQLARQTPRNKIKLEEEKVSMAKRAERVAFQTLVANSPSQRRSEDSLVNTTTRSNNSVNFTQTRKVTNSSSLGVGRRSWAMVVDATTLLDKDSRKSLQLLQGLKGTQLIIPRMVIRELDCLKRRGSLFRRTADVSSVLEWIEECMVKTKWWIHIQNSVEEGRSIAPTPPASPKSLFSEGSSGVFTCGSTSWGPFSSRTSLTEIVSPTAEDHILDCALLFRKIKNDGLLVLLSNDVTLKIKAMAEGLICETAEEFRESLVNPFSERFLWADSSPRGLTWSYLDDEVLRDKYSRRGPLKKPSKGGDGAKGLKLILLHNSHYARMSSVR